MRLALGRERLEPCGMEYLSKGKANEKKTKAGIARGLPLWTTCLLERGADPRYVISRFKGQPLT